MEMLSVWAEELHLYWSKTLNCIKLLHHPQEKFTVERCSHDEIWLFK